MAGDMASSCSRVTSLQLLTDEKKKNLILFRNIPAQATFLYPAAGEMIIFGPVIHYMPIVIIMEQKLLPEKGSYHDISHLFLP